MDIKTNGTNLKITSAMEETLKNKLQFLEKFLKEDDKITVNITKIKNNLKMSSILIYNNKTVKIEEIHEDFYVAVDKIAARLKPQISKLHSLKVKRKNDHDKLLAYIPKDETSLEPKVVKRKNTKLESMTEKEAINIMEENGYEAFVFMNADAENKICMLHIRNDGDYFIVICE